MCINCSLSILPRCFAKGNQNSEVLLNFKIGNRKLEIENELFTFKKFKK